MKKTALSILLALAAFVTPSNISAQVISKGTFINEEKSGFPVVSEHGSLFFNITSLENETPGQWQAFVIAPDGKKTHGPKINFTDPDLDFTIEVKGPILFGAYNLVFYNLSIPNPFLFEFVPYNTPYTVTSSYSSHTAVFGEVDNFFYGPGTYFVTSPFTPFLGH